VVGNAELFLPIPFVQEVKSLRISAFVDIGNVYDTISTDPSGPLRYTAGLAGIWLSPFGVLSVSIAQPLNERSGDETQPFQFTVGTSF
jgi:outer membrane protein insertion porin family